MKFLTFAAVYLATTQIGIRKHRTHTAIMTCPPTTAAIPMEKMDLGAIRLTTIRDGSIATSVYVAPLRLRHPLRLPLRLLLLLPLRAGKTTPAYRLL